MVLLPNEPNKVRARKHTWAVVQYLPDGRAYIKYNRGTFLVEQVPGMQDIWRAFDRLKTVEEKWR